MFKPLVQHDRAENDQPNPDNRALYSRSFDEFVGYYKATKSIYARLNR